LVRFLPRVVEPVVRTATVSSVVLPVVTHTTETLRVVPLRQPLPWSVLNLLVTMVVDRRVVLTPPVVVVVAPVQPVETLDSLLPVAASAVAVLAKTAPLITTVVEMAVEVFVRRLPEPLPNTVAAVEVE
jgi:hypothetical protein